MIPEKGKTYLINYYSGDSQISPDEFYKGPAIYTGEKEDDDLYIFDIPDVGKYNLFTEEDIVSEIKEV